MKRNIIFILITICIFNSCIIRGVFKPREFTYLYTPNNTGLDTLLNIDGCFITNDTTRFDLRYITFWKSNLVSLSYILPLENQLTNKWYRRSIWGTYIINGSSIKVQNILDTGADGGIVVNEYTFDIKNPNKIVLIDINDSIDVSPKNIYSYLSLENRIDSTNWLLKKKWFYKK